MFSRLLLSFRRVLYLPVIGSMLAALAAMLFGAYEVSLTLFSMLQAMMLGEKAVKLLLINLIEGVDVFLLGTAFYLIALGLYELFLDPKLAAPEWLQIESLDDLKSNLLNVVVVVLAVQFLAQVLSWDGSRDLLPFGGAVAAVILSLALFLGRNIKNGGSH